MRRFLVALGCAAMIMATGCDWIGGDKAPADKPAAKPADAKPADAKPADAKPADAKPADAKPAVDPAAVEQCGKILDKAWTAIQPGLAKLKIEGQDKEKYTKSSKTFLERCARLTKEHRDCVEKTDNPIAGIRSCKVNDGKKPDEKLFPATFNSYIKLFEPKEMKGKAAKKLLAGLKGRWVNDWKSAKIKTTWKINAKGEVEETKVAHGKTDKKKFSISFPNTYRMKVQWNESSSQPFFFIKAGKKVFFAGGNLLYGAYPMPNRKSFAVRNNWDYVFFNKGKCTVVAGTGEMTGGKCKFGKQKAKKIFTVEYQFPDAVMANGKPKVDKRIYFVAAKHLLFDSLMSSGRFVRM